MIPSCWTSNSLSSWMILRTLIKCKPSLCSNSKLRSAADKGLLPWVCCLPLLQLLVPNQSSAERSGLGRCSWPGMGLLALDQVQQSGAIHIACALCMWLEISVCTPSSLTSLLLPHSLLQTHLHSAGDFSKELVLHPHQSMALLMGLFFPSRMSTKCSGEHSSPVSASSSTSLPLW